MSVKEAYKKALFGYQLTFFYLCYPTEWHRIYCEIYLNYCKDEFIQREKRENFKKKYWEDFLLLEFEEEHKNLKNMDKMDLETAIDTIENGLQKEGPLLMLYYGIYVLEYMYCDFWKWLNEDEAYQKNKLLSMIACYAPDERTITQKLKLLELAVESYCVPSEFKPHFCTKKAGQSYEERRRRVVLEVEREKCARLKELKEYSDSFTQFSITTKSAELFLSTKEEIAVYLRNIDIGI